MTKEAPLLPLLDWGRCRYVIRDEESYFRRRRRPRVEEKRRIPSGTLLISSSDGVTLCWTPSLPAAEKTAESSVILCYDTSIQLVGKENHLVISLLCNYLHPERYPAKSVHDEDFSGSDSSHEHLCMQTTPESSDDILKSGFVASFRQMPTILLSISLIRILDDETDDGHESTSSPLEQACLKRQLVGCRGVFLDSCVATEISVPFQGSTVRFRVISIIPTPSKSKSRHQSTTPALYIIMPSTRITILESEPPEEQDEPKPVVAESLSSSDTSPAARLLIDTFRCIRTNNSSISRSFLLTGPPGVGKSFSVRLAVQASEARGPTRLVSLRGSELLSTASHPSEASKALHRHFQETARFCRNDNHVGIIFIDECEALLSSDAVAAVLGNLLDNVSSAGSIDNNGWDRIIVVAATNRIDAVPPWLCRPGRFNREIALGPPDASVRLHILRFLLKQSTLRYSDSEILNELDGNDLRTVAEACVGYVPADLAALVRRAALLAFEEGKDQITVDLLRRAMADVGASALRDAALSAPPKTIWDDIAGDAGGAKTALRRAIEWPRTKKHAYESLGLVPPRGILLHGPPGCAKTTLARAAAGASGIAFFSLSPADVYTSSYVGEAEAVVRRAFTLARSAAPCILFFDEIDSILGCNDSSGNSAHGMGRSAKSAEARVLSTFLNEMDGVDASQDDGVLVLGATNRPSTLDSALLRPGRFDGIIFVPPPDEEGRRALLEMQCLAWKCETTESNGGGGESFVNIDLLASDEVTGSMTGAEILGACREAAMRVLRESIENEMEIIPHMKQQYLEGAFRNVKPLLSNKQVLEEYTAFETQRAGTKL